MTTRQFLLKAWNGPFSLGPLTKPVAAGDAIVKLLEIAWKLLIIVLSAWIVIGFLVGSVYVSNEAMQLYNSSFTDTTDNIAGKVTIRVEYQGNDCKAPQPIALILTNNSQSDITSYKWSLRINQKGRSSDLIAYTVFPGNYEGRSDWVLKRGTTLSFCLEMPTLEVPSLQPQEMEFSLQSFTVVQFSPAKE